MEKIRDLWSFFGVEPVFTFRCLWALDTNFLGLRLDFIRFWVCEATFTLSVFLHFLLFRRATDILYIRDQFPTLLLLANRRAFPQKIYFEAHTFPGSMTRRQVKLLQKLDGLVVISEGIRKSFIRYGFGAELWLKRH